MCKRTDSGSRSVVRRSENTDDIEPDIVHFDLSSEGRLESEEVAPDRFPDHRDRRVIVFVTPVKKTSLAEGHDRYARLLP